MRRAAARLLVPLALAALSSPLARAAGYVVTYSGGSANADTYGDVLFAQGSDGYGGGGGRFDSAHGPITATFTWTNDPRDPDPVPAPDQDLVCEGCIVDAQGGGSNGFGDPAVGTRYGERGQPYGMDFVPHYSIKGGNSFAVTCSPSATGDPYGASVTYRASATPLTLGFAGGLCPKTKEILVGQQLTASVDVGDAPTSSQDTYVWSLSDGSIAGSGGDGAPFTSYGVTNSYPTYVPYADPNAPTTAVTFRRPDYVDVSSTVTLASAGVSFTVHDAVQVVQPEISAEELALGNEQIWSSANPPNAPDPWLELQGARLLNPDTGYWGNLVEMQGQDSQTIQGGLWR